VDLAGMWALPADPAAPRSHELIRALDDKGRLMLPSAVAEAATVPAERDGALVTVFLPGSTGRPRPGFTAAALPLDARGRLTLTVGVRREAGIPDGADVLAVLDTDRGVVTVTAASRLSAGIADLLDGLRRPAAAASTSAGDEPVGADAAVPATSSRPLPATPAGDCASSADPHRPFMSGARPVPPPRLENFA
jgi:bifunctional DNA-binding transcriptional regulator/antitoxin component of YhaV-PrlF toxin-antitoxin module